MTKEQPIKIDNIYGIIQFINNCDTTWYLTGDGDVYISYSHDIISDNVIKIKNNIIDYKIKNLHDITKLHPSECNMLVYSSNNKRYKLNISFKKLIIK